VNIRDLIIIGIFGAVHYVLAMVSAIVAVALFSALGYALIGPVLSSLVAAPVLVLLLTKVKKTGVLTISGLILGLLLLFLGNMWALPFLLFGGMVADWIGKRGEYSRSGSIVLALIVFKGLEMTGRFFPLYVFTDQFLGQMADGAFTPGFVQALSGYLTVPFALLLLLTVSLSAAAGTLLGLKLLRKHFKAAGVA
jgi:energy-coupling factor transport system substrate-specific component